MVRLRGPEQTPSLGSGPQRGRMPWLWVSLRSSRSTPLLYLLVLAPYCKPIDMHWNRYYDFGVPDWLPRAVVYIASFNPFPFGPAVLEPDFDLHLAQLKSMSNL